VDTVLSPIVLEDFISSGTQKSAFRQRLIFDLFSGFAGSMLNAQEGSSKLQQANAA
jgi:hypothetical protein